jgi:hypothetical protein
MKTVWANKQAEQIEYCERKHREAGLPIMVRCFCGKNVLLKEAYKCYYCEEYFCEDCAAIHFGKTREQYEADKAGAAL